MSGSEEDIYIYISHFIVVKFAFLQYNCMALEDIILC